MNILHIIRGMANSSGTTHIVGPLAKAQARLGHEVRLMTVEKLGEEPVLPDGGLVRSEVFPMSWKSRHYGYSRRFVGAMDSAMDWAEVVHIHAIWNYVSWYGMKAAHKRGIPYIVAPQGSLEDWALGRSRYAKALYARFFEKPLFDKATAMQALTAAEAEQCEAFGIQAPARILPNGVDLGGIDRVVGVRDLVEAYNLPEDSRVLLFLGRLFPKKGLDILLKGFAKVLPDGVFLLIAGHDAGMGYRDEMEQLAKVLGISERVRFIGELRGEDKFRALRGADGFALTSYSEGLPVAVVEAMACGLPVLITPGCHYPEVDEVEAGWTVEANEAAVEKGVRKMFANSTEMRRRGANARALVERKFVWSRIAVDSVDIYKEMRANG